MYRILYVDDEPDLLDIGKLFLEESGDFTVTTALSAPEGIRLLEQEKFDAIISDYQMPDMDGIQFLVEVRSRFGPIPFILFTGRGREEIVIQAINSGADFYIQKGGEPGAQFAELSHKVRMAVERRTTSEALNMSETRFRTLIEKASDIIRILDRDGRIIFDTAGSEHLLGYPSGFTIGKSPMEFIHPDDLEIVKRELSEVYASTNSGIPTAFRLRKADGSYTWVESTGKNLIGVPGIDGIVITTRFIDERKKAEEAKRESEEKYRTLYQQMTEGAALHQLTYDEQGIPVDYVILETNSAFDRLLGISRDTVIGKTSRQAYGVAEPPYLEIYARVALTGEPESFETYFPPLAKHFFISAYRPSKGRFATLFEDITERRKMEMDLHQANAFLRGAMDQSPAGIAIADAPDGTLRYVNDAGLLIRGGDRQTIVNGVGIDQYVASWQILDLDGRPLKADEVPLARAIMYGETGSRVFVIRRDNDDDRIVHANAAPILDETGKVSAGIVVFTDITDQRLADEARRRSEGRLHTLVQTIPDLVWLKDKEGVYLLCNSMFERFFGAREVDIVGKTDYDFVDRTLSDLFRENDRKAMLAGKPTSNEEWITFADDGHRALLETIKTPMFDDKGTLIGVLGIGHDITERKRIEEVLAKKNEELNASYEQVAAAQEELRGNLDELARQEQALRESEASLREILDATPFPVALVDLQDNNINFWSRSALTLFGHTAPTAAEWYQLAYPDHGYRQKVIDRWKPYLERAKLSGQPVNTGEYRVTCHNGSVRICELYATFLSDKLVVTFNDVTERKVALAALTENEERLRTTLEILPVGIFIFSKTGQILAANAMVNRIWGVTEGVVPHSSDMQEFVEYKGWWPDTGVALRPEDWAASRVLMKGEAAPVDVVNIQRFDGSHGTIIVSAVPIHDALGNVNGAVAVIQDITERKVAEEALLKNAEELQSAYEELTASEEELRQNVDDLGRSERVLRESEDRFRGIFDTITSGVAIYEVRNDGASGKDYIIKDFNKTALEIEGKTKEDVVGKSLFDLRPTIDDYGLIPVFQEVWKSGIPAYFPQKVYIDEKYSNWYENRVFRLQSGEIVAVYDDVTERKQSELERESALESLKEAHSLAHIGTWDWVTKTDTITWSEELCSIAGWDLTKPAPTYAELPRFYSPTSWELLNDAVTRALTTGESYNLELEMIRPDGSRRWTNAFGGVQRDRNGKVTGLHGTVQDITEQKLLDDTRAFLVQCGYPGSGEDFFNTLARYLAEHLDMSYVCIDTLEGDGLTARTVAIYNDGKFDTNVTYALKDTPCGDVVGKRICCFQQEVCRLFPHDAALRDLNAESYVGTTLWSSDHTPIGLIAVIGRKPLKDPALAEAVLELVAVRAAGEMERSRAEEALKESNEVFSQFMHHSPIYTYIKTVTPTESRVLQASDNFAQMIGISGRDMTGRTMTELFPAEIAKKITADDWAVVAKGEVLKIREAMNGRNYITIKFPIVQGDKTLLGGYTIDITERTRAEEALRESEGILQAIIEKNPMSIQIVDREGFTLRVNPAFIRLFGSVPPPDFSIITDLVKTHPEIENYISQVKSGKPVNLPDMSFNPHDIYPELPDVPTRVRAIIFPLNDKHGKPQRFVFMHEDITEQRRTEEALRQANRKLNLLSGITRHDINNQLLSLNGYLEISKKYTGNAEKMSEFIAKEETVAKTMSRQISFTREYEAIGVNAPVWEDCRTLADTAAKQAPLGQVTVKNDFPVGQEVFADPLVVKVFYNLMDNAARYGGKITTIRFSYNERDGDHLLVCEDDGEGVLPEEKEMIFEKGYGKNTGMGLFLSREILSITGITIRETGEPGKGARFEMTVPKGAWRMTGKGA